jgi:hypothetical protein
VNDRTLIRLLNALPDAVTCTFFLTLWISPFAFGPDGVRNAMLTMVVEFIVVHASAFLGAAAFAADVSRAKKLSALAGFGLFYLLFIAAWSYIFKQWWPFVTFGWLLLGKVAVVMDTRQTPDEVVQRITSNQVLSTLAYLGGAFLTIFAPIPQLGLTPDVVSRLGLIGSGLWVDKPHTVLAFGTIYFGFLSWIKWRNSVLPSKSSVP